MSTDEMFLSMDRTIAAVFGQLALQYRTGTGVVVDLWDAARNEPRAIFTESYAAQDGNIAPIASLGPALFVRLIDLPVDPETDTGADVIKSGKVYHVQHVRPDGEGGATLYLHEDGP